MTAARHRFTVSDYYRMGDSGVFPPDGRVELLEGEIRDMMPIGPFHSGIVNYLSDFFSSCHQGRWLVINQNPVQLNKNSEPQPDIVLARRDPGFYRDRHPGPEDVLVLIEVAESSLEYDRGDKLAAYGKAGIQEYWLVNVAEQCVEVYREPHCAGYGRAMILHAGDTVSPASFPDVTLHLADLLVQRKGRPS